jgi:hypothetical protein
VLSTHSQRQHIVVCARVDAHPAVQDAGFVDSLEAVVIKGSWQDVAGPSGRLITDVLGMLHKHIIKKPLADLTQAGNKTSSGAAWHITLVKRLKTDLSILMNPRNLNNLKVGSRACSGKESLWVGQQGREESAG